VKEAVDAIFCLLLLSVPLHLDSSGARVRDLYHVTWFQSLDQARVGDGPDHPQVVAAHVRDCLRAKIDALDGDNRFKLLQNVTLSVRSTLFFAAAVVSTGTVGFKSGRTATMTDSTTRTVTLSPILSSSKALTSGAT
jgi:hypothetical protein